jgi:hypothetical protein
MAEYSFTLKFNFPNREALRDANRQLNMEFNLASKLRKIEPSLQADIQALVV